MVITKVSLRYFILGMLSQQPMSGYDIKQFIESMSWLIGSSSCGSLYPALQGMLCDGLVTMEVVPGKGKPSRKIYTITAAGQAAVQDWMRSTSAPGSLKAFIMRLVMAGHVSPAEVIEQLRQRRAQVASLQSALKQAPGQGLLEDNLGQHLALDYGLAVARAELAWLDATLSGLGQTAGTPVAASAGL